jgi:hypothetical protein
VERGRGDATAVIHGLVRVISTAEVVPMLFLIAFVGAAIIALVLWKAMNATRSDTPIDTLRPPTRRPPQAPRARATGPDDDPDFLRQLDERVKRRDDPPTV